MIKTFDGQEALSKAQKLADLEIVLMRNMKKERKRKFDFYLSKLTIKMKTIQKKISSLHTRE